MRIVHHELSNLLPAPSCNHRHASSYKQWDYEALLSRVAVRGSQSNSTSSTGNAPI